MPEAVKVNGKHYAESTRAASLATHASASLLLAAARLHTALERPKFLEAARLLRSAEALTRAATAILSTTGSAPQAPNAGTAEQAKPAVGTRRRRRRPRKKKKKKEEMDVDGMNDEWADDVKDQAPRVPTEPQAAHCGPTLQARRVQDEASVQSVGAKSPDSRILQGSTVLRAGSVMVVRGVENRAHRGVRVQLIDHGPGGWTCELEPTGEYVVFDPSVLHPALFASHSVR